MSTSIHSTAPPATENEKNHPSETSLGAAPVQQRPILHPQLGTSVRLSSWEEAHPCEGCVWSCFVPQIYGKNRKNMQKAKKATKLAAKAWFSTTQIRYQYLNDLGYCTVITLQSQDTILNAIGRLSPGFYPCLSNFQFDVILTLQGCSWSKVLGVASTCFNHLKGSRLLKVSPRHTMPSFFTYPFPGFHPILKAMRQHLGWPNFA